MSPANSRWTDHVVIQQVNNVPYLLIVFGKDLVFLYYLIGYGPK